MKKKRHDDVEKVPRFIRKWLLTMKLFFVIMVLAFSSLHATSYSQVRLNLELKDVTLKEAFQQITRQTGYEFVYSSSELKYTSRISLKVENMELSEVLAECLKETKLGYILEDGIIVISPKVDLPKKQQQDEMITVTGVVLNKETREAIPGVTVIVKGTSLGVVTDLHGKFSIRVKNDPEQALQFSFIGMISQSIQLKNRPESGSWTIYLEEDMQSLEDVVVTGYQNVRAHENAASVFKVKTEDIAISSASSIDQMLQGRIPGLMALNTSGEPSAAPKIRIRGNATINGNKSPVWVVDGVIVESTVPFSASDINSEDAEYLIGNAIAGLNPQDIETITVLKDASATAIYGVRAANGVIVLTTKRGKSGAPVVRYSGSLTLNSRPSYRQYDRMDSRERVQLSKEIVEQGLTYSKVPVGDSYEGYYQRLLNKEISQAEFETAVNTMQERNTDWYDILFRNEVNHNHTLSISGGGEHSSYYFSAGYNKSRGAAIGSSSDRYNVLAKGDFFLKDWLQILLKFEFNSRKNDGFNGVNPQSYAYNTSRTLPAYNQDGSYHKYMTDNGYLYNVINERNETGSNSKIDAFSGVFGLTVKLLPGLSFQSTFSLSNSNTQKRSWETEYSNAITYIRRYEHGMYDVDHDSYSNSRLPYGGILEMENTRMSGYMIRNTLEYRNVFDEVHELSVFGGVEATSTKHEGNSVTGYGWNPLYGEMFNPVSTESFTLNYVSKGLLLPTSTNKTKQIASFFGTFAYIYDNRYVLNANIRSDGSNKFGSDPKYRWLPTWSVAGKWIVTGEKFMDNVYLFNNLTLRGSFGTQGNIHDDATPYLITKYKERDYAGLEVHTIEKIPNPSLRWEKTTSWNVALDFSMLKNRIRGSVDVYRKNGKDMVSEKTTPSSTGRNTMMINASKMRNSGVEGFIEAQIIRNENFEWKFGVNFARNVNKVTLSNEDTYSNSEIVDMMLEGNLSIKGDALGTIYSYHFAGLSPENGYTRFWAKDRETYPDPVYFGHKEYLELVKSGSIYPDISGGFDTQLTFRKNLSLELAFTYSLGNVERLPDVYENERYVLNPLRNVSTNLLDRWKKPGDENRTSVPALFDSNLFSSFIDIDGAVARPAGGTYALPQALYNKSDIRVAPADFLKLKSATLVYRMPKELTDRMYFNTLNLRFQMTNIFAITNKKWKGLDPESAKANIPLVPTYNFSLDFTF